MNAKQEDKTGKRWTEEELKRLADELSKRHWGKPCTIPVSWNGRLKKTMGRFMYHERLGKREALRIELSKFAAQTLNEATWISVLLHELCHYHLFIAGQPFEDGHPRFEQELRRVGAATSHTIRLPQQGYKLFCSQCERPLGVRKRINTAHYRSACCGATIIKERYTW